MPGRIAWYNDIIARIYGGAHDQAAWNSANAEIVERFGLAFAFVAMADLEAGAFARSEVHGDTDPRFLAGLAEYQAERYRTDPTIPLTAARPRAGFIDTQADLDWTVPAVAEHMRWNKAALGSERWFLFYTPPDDGFSFGFSAHFAAGDAAFSAVPQALLKGLFGHMANAQRLAARPPRLDHDAQATLLIDARGRVRTVSPAAEALLARHRLATIQHGRLLLADPDDRSQLEAVLAGVLQALDGGGTTGGVKLADGTILLVQGRPMPTQPLPVHGPLAVVRLVAPAGPHTTVAVWRQLYGLSQAEGRVAAALVAGEINLKAVADVLGMAHATARVHLARIFDKTGCSSQAQLVRQLSLVSAHWRPPD